jgi:ribosomal protein L7/L12
MPSDYRCKECGLQFSVGWYHYHSLSTGFIASTLAVCTQCCAQHRVEQAGDSSAAPASLSFFDVTIDEVPAPARTAVMATLRANLGLSLGEAKRLVDQPPIVLGRDVPEYAASQLKATYAAVGAIVGCSQTRAEANLIVQQQDRLLVANTIQRTDQEPGVVWEPVGIRGVRTGVTGIFKLDEQPCAHCAVIGALTTDPAKVPALAPDVTLQSRRRVAG